MTNPWEPPLQIAQTAEALPWFRRKPVFRTTPSIAMENQNQIFARLAKSAFRARFRLTTRDAAYIASKGLPAVLAHAHEIITKRLAPARPPNDGKQTPYRGHPVFVAQHATGACCRGCLAKLHGIPQETRLEAAEVAHIVAVIERWLKAELERLPPAMPTPKRNLDLFD